MTDSKDQEQVSWLIKIQQESWQAEIILSGLIIFTLTQIPDFVSNKFYILGTQYLGFADLGMFEDLLKTGVYWLILGFLIHLILRGVWAGFVGLSYAFPEGIKKDETRFAPRFQAVIERIPSPRQSIIRLEKYCSALFSVSFMLFMIILGLSIFNLIFNYLFYWATMSIGFTSIWPARLINIIAGVFFLLYFIDFLTAGLIKRIRWLAPVYYPAYWVLNLSTLSFLYRNIYYTFVTNFDRRLVIVAFVLYVTATFFIFQSVRSGSPRLEYMSYDRNAFQIQSSYDNLRQADTFVRNASIQSDIVSDSFLRLFIVYKIQVDDVIDCLDEEELSRDKKFTDQKLDCLDDFYVITLDDKEKENLQWRYHYLQTTGEYGIITYLDINDLSRGLHTLTIRYKIVPQFHPDDFIYAQIPFVKN